MSGRGAAGARARVRALVLALALAATLALAGCSTKRALERPVPPGDGVAPWAPSAAAVVICDGPVRLVAPGPGGAPARIGGACTDPARAGAACAADADCGLRERCLCGTCAAPVCTSEDRTGCGAALECVQTSATSADVKRCLRLCAADADCAPSERCVEQPDTLRACTGTCAADADCAAGERCNASGGCVLSLCDSTDTTCAPGLSCALEGVAALATGPSARPLGDSDAAGVELYFARDGAIWRARSADGFTFAVAGGGPALTAAAPWEGAALAAPAVAAGADGALRLFYAAADGAGIGLAVSTDDGETWERRAAPVLAAADSFAGTTVASPAAAQDGDGAWLLYYEGDAGAGIGLARSADGETFTPAPDPVLLRADVEDPALWHDLTRIGAPDAAWERDAAGAPRVRLWFAGVGIESGDALFMGMPDPAQPNASIGYAAGPDGAAFSVYAFDPVFDRPLAAVNHLNEDEPSVLRRDGGAFFMYFDGRDESGLDPEGIVLAEAPPPAN